MRAYERGLHVVPKKEYGTVAVDVAGLDRLAGSELRGWYRQLEQTGGCARPVYLVGHTMTRDRATGAVVHYFTSHSQPFGRLMIACRNRRDAVCPACALLHKGDTYQIVVSGLAGGKGVDPEVSRHPRVFATLTAPSFGLVHGAGRAVCRAGKGQPTCPHGRALYCLATHQPGDDQVGTPLCPDCYDYAGAVLFNAYAGQLWNRFCIQVRRDVATAAGIARTKLGTVLRVSFVKVVEYQRRGAVHLHAVIRFDGPDGPGDQPPDWATAELLAQAARGAGPAVSLRIPDPDGGIRVLRFGAQLDVREIVAGDSAGLSARAVGSYVAKYVTKGDIPGLVHAWRFEMASQIRAAPYLTDHGKRLVLTAWNLGGRPEYEALRLRNWAQQLGFRGHIATKSRVYSTTYGALRAARADFRRQAAGLLLPHPDTTETQSNWHYVESGLTPAQAEIAASMAAQTAIRRGPKPDWIDDQPRDEP